MSRIIRSFDKPLGGFLRRKGWDVLAVLAILALHAAWAYVVTTNPTLTRGYDPEFDYFVTSLAPFKGASYAYVDHPGTPVAILGTAFMALALPLVGGSPAALIDFHLRHPEVFFQIAYGFLFVAYLACALFFYFTARSTGRAGPLLALGLALMYYAVDPSAIWSIAYWSHATFNFPFGTLYLLALFRILRRTRADLPNRTLIGLGVASGVLTSIVLYLGAWVAAALVAVAVLYRSRGISSARTAGAAATIALSALAGFALAIIPILWKWTDFGRWVLKLVLNQGRFGNGQPGVFSLSASAANLSRLVSDVPALFYVLGILLAILATAWLAARRASQARPVEWSVVAGLLVQILLLLVMISKSGFSFYLLPVDATVPVLALTVICLLPDTARLRVALTILLPLFVFYQVSVIFYQRAFLQHRLAAAIAADQAALMSVIQRAPTDLNTPADGIHIIWAYGVFEPCNALLDGNYYAGLAFTDELAVVCPRQYYLPHGSKSLFIDGERVGIENAVGRGWIIVMRESETTPILQLLPGAAVELVPSSSSTYGDLAVIYPGH